MRPGHDVRPMETDSVLISREFDAGSMSVLIELRFRILLELLHQDSFFLFINTNLSLWTWIQSWTLLCIIHIYDPLHSILLGDFNTATIYRYTFYDWTRFHHIWYEILSRLINVSTKIIRCQNFLKFYDSIETMNMIQNFIGNRSNLM